MKTEVLWVGEIRLVKLEEEESDGRIVGIRLEDEDFDLGELQVALRKLKHERDNLPETISTTLAGILERLKLEVLLLEY